MGDLVGARQDHLWPEASKTKMIWKLGWMWMPRHLLSCMDATPWMQFRPAAYGCLSAVCLEKPHRAMRERITIWGFWTFKSHFRVPDKSMEILCFTSFIYEGRPMTVGRPLCFVSVPLTVLCWHPDSNLPDGREMPHHKYIRGVVLGCTHKIDSYVLPTPLNFTGGEKGAKFGLNFVP